MALSGPCCDCLNLTEHTYIIGYINVVCLQVFEPRLAGLFWPCGRIEAMTIKRGTPEYRVQRRRVLAKARAARKPRTHCKRGHPLAGDNVRVMSTERRCRKCEALRVARWRARREFDELLSPTSA